MHPDTGTSSVEKLTLEMNRLGKLPETGNVGASAREYLTAVEVAGGHLEWFRILSWLEDTAIGPFVGRPMSFRIPGTSLARRNIATMSD